RSVTDTTHHFWPVSSATKRNPESFWGRQSWESRNGGTRTGRQFHKLNFNRARGRQRTRLAWDEEKLGAAPRRATISAPVAEKISGIRLLNGTTQVPFRRASLAQGPEPVEGRLLP